MTHDCTQQPSSQQVLFQSDVASLSSCGLTNFPERSEACALRPAPCALRPAPMGPSAFAPGPISLSERKVPDIPRAGGSLSYDWCAVFIHPSGVTVDQRTVARDFAGVCIAHLILPVGHHGRCSSNKPPCIGVVAFGARVLVSLQDFPSPAIGANVCSVWLL